MTYLSPLDLKNPQKGVSMINTNLKNRFTKIFWEKMLKIYFLYELSPIYQKSLKSNFYTKYRRQRKNQICFEKLMQRGVFFVITVIQKNEKLKSYLPLKF